MPVLPGVVLAGGRNFREIGDRGAELPPGLPALADWRVHPASGRCVVPARPRSAGSYMDGIDADAAEGRVSAWLRADALASAIVQDAASDPSSAKGMAGRLVAVAVAVAMDGKTTRNTIEPGGAEGGEIKLFLGIGT
jgi:hypothetical protein